MPAVRVEEDVKKDWPLCKLEPQPCPFGCSNSKFIVFCVLFLLWKGHFGNQYIRKGYFGKRHCLSFIWNDQINLSFIH